MATPISEEELQLKKRARRRLIGAIALAIPVQIEQSSSYTTVAFDVIGELLVGVYPRPVGHIGTSSTFPYF